MKQVKEVKKMSELQGLRTTSLIAYVELLEKLQNREKQVLLSLERLNEANNLMISKDLGFEINQITGRTNSLKKKGLIKEMKIDICPFTGRKTIFYGRVKK